MKLLLAPKSVLHILIIALIVTVFGSLYLYNANPFATASSFYLKVLLVNISFIGDAFFAFAIIGYTFFVIDKKMLAVKVLVHTLFVCLIFQVINNINVNSTFYLFFESSVASATAYKVTTLVSSHAAISTMLFFVLLSVTKKVYLLMVGFALVVAVFFSRYYLFQDAVLSITMGVLVASISFTSIQFLIKAIVKPQKNTTVNFVLKQFKYLPR